MAGLSRALAAAAAALAAACAATGGALGERALPGYDPPAALAAVLEAADAAGLQVAAADVPAAEGPLTLVLVQPSRGAVVVAVLEPAADGAVLSLHAAGGAAPPAAPEAGSPGACLPCLEAAVALADTVADRGRGRLESREAARRLLEALDRLAGTPPGRGR